RDTIHCTHSNSTALRYCSLFPLPTRSHLPSVWRRCSETHTTQQQQQQLLCSTRFMHLAGTHNGTRRARHTDDTTHTHSLHTHTPAASNLRRVLRVCKFSIKNIKMSV